MKRWRRQTLRADTEEARAVLRYEMGRFDLASDPASLVDAARQLELLRLWARLHGLKEASEKVAMNDEEDPYARIRREDAERATYHRRKAGTAKRDEMIKAGLRTPRAESGERSAERLVERVRIAATGGYSLATLAEELLVKQFGRSETQNLLKCAASGEPTVRARLANLGFSTSTSMTVATPAAPPSRLEKSVTRITRGDNNQLTTQVLPDEIHDEIWAQVKQKAAKRTVRQATKPARKAARAAMKPIRQLRNDLRKMVKR